MCDKCDIYVNGKPIYLIEVNGMWQTKMNGLTTDPNHFDLIRVECKEDAETICEVFDLFSSLYPYKRIPTEHLYLNPNLTQSKQ